MVIFDIQKWDFEIYFFSLKFQTQFLLFKMIFSIRKLMFYIQNLLLKNVLWNFKN